jgi:hydrophobic/amphiphilic exporter-1 (mainly G- bacteria), HAE1 family
MIGLSIRRPVAIAMVYISVGLLGVAAWNNIPIELLPDASFPQLTLSYQWPGASPETAEAFATAPIEAVVQQVRGVESIASTTREGSGTIRVEFQRDVDMDFTRLDLMERVATLEEDLPDGVSQINVQPYVPRDFQDQATRPLLSYTFTGPLLLEALRLHIEQVLVPEILQVRGVSDVEVQGGRARLLEIELDEDQIAALGLSPDQVSAAINQLDLVREAGAIRDGTREWSLTIRSRPATAADLRQALLPLPSEQLRQTPLRLDDVAVVRDTFEEARSHYRINGSPAVGFRIYKQYGTNTVRLSEQVRERIRELEALNPPGTELLLIDDQAEEIHSQLTDLRTRALIAAGVIFLVLLGFLRAFRTAAVVFSTIAFSILIALNLIYFGGLTLNLLTLMGLALGFGLIVDNSIVVLENIFRKWQEGADPPAASEKGARDVVLPIVASTATTLIVFLPFLYLQGELRVYYLPLAVVVALTLVASIFVAFTFIPALTARVLGRRKAPEAATYAVAGTGSGDATPMSMAPNPLSSHPPGGSAGPEAPLDPDDPDRNVPLYAREGKSPIYIRFYSGLLGYTLRFPWVTVAVAVMAFAGTFYLFDNYVNRGVVWGGGFGQQRSTVTITLQLPRGTDLERVNQLTGFFEDRLRTMPEVSRFEANVSQETGRIVVEFPEELEFTAIPLVIEERLRAFSLNFSGANVRVFGQGPSFGGGGGGSAPNYRITLLGYNYNRLADLAEDMGERFSAHTRIHEVNTNATAGFSRTRATEFVTEVDREATVRHDISVAEASQLIQASLRGAGRSGLVKLGGEEVQYEVKLAGYREADVQRLLETIVTTSRGSRITIGDLVNVREREVLSIINREDQQYERTVAYEFRGPTRLGNMVRDEVVEATVLPAGYSIRERTPWQISSADEQQFLLVLLVSIGLVFMVTAGLFESVRQPLCVLLAVPMALIGVFLTFFFVDATFTREAYIGVIMMGGIVVNNAILLVDHINRVRSETSLPIFDAITRGTLERVRPILMTTTTTVLGLLPLVLFMPSADATIWNALTYSLIGGLLSSTIFVLTTTPALYYLFERIGRSEEALHGPAAVPARAPSPAPSGPALQGDPPPLPGN